MIKVVIKKNPPVTTKVHDNPADVNVNIQDNPTIKADGTDDIALNSINRYLGDDLTIEDVKSGDAIVYNQETNQFINTENRVVIKHSKTVPEPENLIDGELAYSYLNNNLYIGDANNDPIVIATGDTSQSSNFIYNNSGELERINYDNGEYKTFVYSNNLLTETSLYNSSDTLIKGKLFTYNNGELINIQEV